MWGRKGEDTCLRPFYPYVDGYGNLRLTIRRNARGLFDGAATRVRIGEVERAAPVSDGSFAIEADDYLTEPFGLDGLLARIRVCCDGRARPERAAWRGPRGAHMRYQSA